VAVVPLPPGEQRTLHAVTARGADRVPAVRAALDALLRVVAQRAERAASAAGGGPGLAASRN
jgi:DNA-binding transcriptional LysR family regulator